MPYRSGDRRTHARFEILGHVWGTLETVVSMNVLNISQGGALVECPVPLKPDSVHQIAVTRGDERAVVEVRVCHARPGDTPATYNVGLEFIALSSAMRALVNRLA